jgi:hypothetical protein
MTKQSLISLLVIYNLFLMKSLKTLTKNHKKRYSLWLFSDDSGNITQTDIEEHYIDVINSKLIKNTPFVKMLKVNEEVKMLNTVQAHGQHLDRTEFHPVLFRLQNKINLLTGNQWCLC